MADGCIVRIRENIKNNNRERFNKKPERFEN